MDTKTEEFETENKKGEVMKNFRNIVKNLEMQIYQEKIGKIEAEKKNSELEKEFVNKKVHCEELITKLNKIQGKKNEESDDFKKKIEEMTQKIEKLESSKEKEKKRYENAENQLKKYTSFIEDLQDELKYKQNALSELTEAFNKVEEKLFYMTEEKKQLKFSLESCQSKNEKIQHKNFELQKNFYESQRILKTFAEIFDFSDRNTEDLLEKIENERKEFLEAGKVNQNLENKIKETNEN